MKYLSCDERFLGIHNSFYFFHIASCPDSNNTQLLNGIMVIETNIVNPSLFRGKSQECLTR